jgi:cytochrome c biogenesis protein
MGRFVADSKRTGALGGRPTPGRLRRLGPATWHLLISMRVALIVILCLAVLALVGSILPQAPQSALADPEARAAWLATIRPTYGELTPLLDQLGLLTVFSSTWFRVLAGYLAISLVACVIHRVNRFWRTSVRPTVRTGPDFFEHAPQREAVLADRGLEETLEGVRRVLGRRRYRILAEGDRPVELYADRNRWGPLGSLAGHLALLLILAGAVIGSAFGFSEPGFLVTEGFSAAVPGRSGLTLELEAFRDTYYPTTGAPADVASDIVLRQDGTEVARKTVRVNDPLRYDGLSFYQREYGPAAVMQVADDSGRTIAREGVPLPYSTTNDRTLGSFDIAAAGLTAVIVGPASSGDTVVRPGQLAVMLYATEGDTSPVAAATLDQGTAAALAGLTFTFERESQYTSLKIASDPGMPLVWLGCTLLVAGFAVGLLFPHRRVWARLEPRPGGGTRLAIASTSRYDTGVDTEFGAVVDDIRGSLGARPTPRPESWT